MKTINRYIPELVYNQIQNLEFKNKEQLYVICDMIYRISIYRKENTDYSNVYRDIPTRYYTDIIADKKNYMTAMTLLKTSGIIECDNVYSKIGGKALGYRFNNKYVSKLITVQISKPTIFKKITSNVNKERNLVADEYKTYRDFFINNFSIDYDNALLYLDNWYNKELELIHYTSPLNSPLCSSFLDKYIKLNNKYNFLFMSISSINDGNLFFRYSNTNGRIDTNLTNLKAELKQFINTPNLYQIDIVNSQPFILSLLLNSPLCSSFLDKKELERYTDWTSAGIFYEMFEREYFNKTSKVLTRKQIKDLMFCIFYSKNGSYIKEKNIFKSIFPTIMKFIDEQKKDKHNEFSIRLQKIESKICINIICKELDKEDIKYYTIHDAWLVDEKDIKKTRDIIIRKFYDNFYRRPELKIEKIS
jgi:hypothetical protein